MNLGLDQLLILSDLDFIFAIKDYFTKIAEYAKAKSNKNDTRNRNSAIQEPGSATAAHLDPPSGKQASPMTLPKIKVMMDVRNLCVAIVESSNTEAPQALQLKVSVCPTPPPPPPPPPPEGKSLF